MNTVIDGIVPMFKIGLSGIPATSWLEIDQQCDDYLSQKAELMRTRLGDVFVARDDTYDSQSEVLDLVHKFLFENTEFSSNSRDSDIPPLLQAASLVQEDIVIMRRMDKGWTMVAASVCFPSNWWVTEKFGMPISEIHRPIPGFGPQSRNNKMIGRIFDNMPRDQIVGRYNWSLTNNDELPNWPNSDDIESGKQVDILGQVFVRMERQTLRKLPKSGDILFTIRIHNKSIADLCRKQDGVEALSRVENVLDQLNEEQWRYKGLWHLKDSLLGKISEVRTQAELNWGNRNKRRY